MSSEPVQQAYEESRAQAAAEDPPETIPAWVDLPLTMHIEFVHVFSAGRSVGEDEERKRDRDLPPSYGRKLRASRQLGAISFRGRLSHAPDRAVIEASAQEVQARHAWLARGHDRILWPRREPRHEGCGEHHPHRGFGAQRDARQANRPRRRVARTQRLQRRCWSL